MIGGVGWTEFLVVVLVVAVIFGPRRIPEVFRGLGEGLREFRSALRNDPNARLSTPRDGVGGGAEKRPYR